MEINVERTKLIEILKNNAKTHKEEFEALKAAYMRCAKIEALTIASMLENDNFDTSIRITAVKPTDYSSDYITVIGMLELSSDAEFKLSEKDYKKYILNEWEWSGSVAMTKTAYGML